MNFDEALLRGRGVFFVDARSRDFWVRASGRGLFMTKADLARVIYDAHGGLTNRESLRVIDILFDVIKDRLMQGESVRIVGFGTLEVAQRKSRRGRNPITGETIEVSSRRALVFRPSRSIRSV